MRKRRWIIGLFFFFIILLISSPWSVRWIQRTFLTQDLTFRLEREAAIPFSGTWGIYPGGEGLFLIRNAEIRFIHPRQEEDWAFGTETLVPVAAARGNHVYVMESSPRYLFKINQQGHMLYQQAANRNAEKMTADRDQYLLIQHPPENRLLPFSIMDPEGRLMGSILLTEGEILAQEIASSHNRVFISVLRLAGTGYETVLLGYDLQGVLQSSHSFSQKLVVDVMVTEDGRVVVLTDQSLQVLSLNMEEKWRQPVDPYYLSAHDGKQHWVLAHRGQKHTGPLPYEEKPETVLTHMDFIREDTQVFPQVTEVSDLVVGEAFFVLRNGRGIHIHQQDGRLIDEHAFLDDVEDVFLLPENRLAVLMRGRILIYQLSTDS